MIAFLFFLFSGMAIASAILMISHRNPIYSALFLIVTLFALAGHFVLLNAPFIAAVHIIVYAGAIMVLFLFVIMLLEVRTGPKRERLIRPVQVVGVVLAILLLLELGFMLNAGVSGIEAAEGARIVGDTGSIGTLLFTRYLFAFEVASVLLLSAIIGSVILARIKLKT